MRPTGARARRRRPDRSRAEIVILAVGRLRAGPIRSLIDDYLDRIGWSVGEHEVEVANAPTGAARAAREAERLLAAAPAGGVLVSLDPAGDCLTSEAFAARLQAWREAEGTVTFAIGGAEGHGPAVTRAAHACLAFGPMTWPHALVRVLLAEQLWRAYAIVTGHPYHRLDRDPVGDQ